MRYGPNHDAVERALGKLREMSAEDAWAFPAGSHETWVTVERAALDAGRYHALMAATDDAWVIARDLVWDPATVLIEIGEVVVADLPAGAGRARSCPA